LYSGLPQHEPEPVAHLWECLGRWSAMIAHDGEHADLSPPSWLCDAIQVATAPPKKDERVIDKSMAKRIATQLGWEPKREWVGLTDEEIENLWGEPVDCMWSGNYNAIRDVEAKLKEKNGV